MPLKCSGGMSLRELRVDKSPAAILRISQLVPLRAPKALLPSEKVVPGGKPEIITLTVSEPSRSVAGVERVMVMGMS